MRQPDIDGLLDKVDSRYTLVVTAARRARQLIEGDPERVDSDKHKPISIALREIASDEVKWSRDEVNVAKSAAESADTEPGVDAEAPDADTDSQDA